MAEEEALDLLVEVSPEVGYVSAPAVGAMETQLPFSDKESGLAALDFKSAKSLVIRHLDLRHLQIRQTPSSQSIDCFLRPTSLRA